MMNPFMWITEKWKARKQRNKARATAEWLLDDLRNNKRHELPSTETVAENVRLIKDAIAAAGFSADKTSRLVAATERQGRRLNRHAALRNLTRLQQTSKPTHISVIKARGEEIRSQFAAGSVEAGVPKKLNANIETVVRRTISRHGYADAAPNPL